VAFGPGNAHLILDNGNSRVVSSTPAGLRVVAAVDRTAEDIAVGPNGAIAVYSPVLGKVEVFSAAGTSLGTVDVPRQIRHVSRIELGASLQVFAYSVLQERHGLGSPSAPRALGSILRSNVEGSFRPSARTGVVSIVNGAKAELRVLSGGIGERAQVVQSLPIPGDPVDAVQIADGDDSIVCARTESVSQSTSEVNVQRRLVCADIDSGAWLLDMELAPPGPYLPHRELALRADASSLSVLHAIPSTSGLELKRCEVSR